MSENNWTFIVVVNGVPVVVRINCHDKIADLMREALKSAGVAPFTNYNHRRPYEVVGDLAFWELLKDDGTILASTELANMNIGKGSVERIIEAGLKNGEKLYLGPEPGAGA